MTNLERQIRALGRRFDADALACTRALFEPMWSPDADDVRVETVAYGEDERQRADIYRRADARARPVLIFVPGGGFVGGSRDGYAAFGRHLAAMGLVVVVADYRLAPKWTWPSGAEDAARVIEWAGGSAARFGGDPESLFAFGHSAGATHLAGAIFDPRLRPANIGDVRGVILASGAYRVEPDEERANVLAYFGEDRSLFPDRSPLSHAGATANLLVLAAELDPEIFLASAAALGAAAGASDPPFRLIRGHNHFSTVLAVGTEHDVLGGLIRRQIADAVSAGGNRPG